jgi:predicted RNase H-like HicB family nuclease
VSWEEVARPMSYVVDLDRDEDGAWVATARGVQGCHTQGRSILQALSRIREALAVCIDKDVVPDEIETRVHLPAEVRLIVAEYESACTRLELEQKAAHSATGRAVETLVRELSLSVRDAGAVLGLSHQRVHQLANRRSG